MSDFLVGANTATHIDKNWNSSNCNQGYVVKCILCEFEFSFLFFSFFYFSNSNSFEMYIWILLELGVGGGRCEESKM